MIIDPVLGDQLTPEQYSSAVDPARDVLCLACAGSGKSRTLAFRTARLLAEGAQPHGIVAFTLNGTAAESIKRRVSQALLAASIDPTLMGATFPIAPDALGATLSNIEWAIDGILRSDFPMRPQLDKCAQCDLRQICSKFPDNLDIQLVPPELHLPAAREMVRASSRYQGPRDAG